MGIFNFKKNKNKETEERSNIFGDYLSYNSNSSYVESKSMLLSAVYRCVEVISDAIAQLPLEPYLIDNKGFRNKFTSHPTYSILNRMPNQNMTKFTFIKIMVRSMLLNGNAFAIIDRDEKGNCIALHFIPSSLVTIIYPKNLKDTISYRVQGMKGVIENCNMIHILNHTIDGINGISTLQHAKNTLSLASDAEANAQGFFRGGANVAGILKSSSPMTSKQKEGLKQSWNSAFNGVTGTPNGVAVLDADLSFQAVQINPADSQLLETRAFNVVDICRFFGVSPVKAFDLSKSSYNTIEQMQLAFLTDTLQPLIEKFEEEFKRKIFKPSEIDNIDVRFSTAPLLRADKQSLAQYYSTLFQIGVITPNEIRKELDFGELADGNESFVQVNVQSLKKAMRNEEEEGDTNDNK
nr:MAG TPA: portal protein [Siphoviridae sp. ctTYz13]